MAELLTFEIENFRSFYKAQTVVFGEAKARTLTALYGANAGGKSNVVKALGAMFSCIVYSSAANWRLPYEPFLLKQGALGKPTRFKVAFRHADRFFVYEFSFNGERILSETLLERSANSLKNRTIFSRDESVTLNSTAAKNKFGKRLSEKTRPETLIVTKAREDNNEYANIVFALLSDISIIDDGFARGPRTPQFIEMLRRDERLKDKAIDLLRKCDIAIRDVRIRQVAAPDGFISSMPEGFPPQLREAILEQGVTEFKTVHAVRDEEDTVIGMTEFDFSTMESMGTQKFFEVAVPIIDAMETGKMLFVDEFSSYIHPVLAKAIINLFKGQQDEGSAKLVLITHNTAMMSDLERDEMLIVEKTLGEESRVISLADAGARKDDAFERRYRAGYYGGVPFIRD